MLDWSTGRFSLCSFLRKLQRIASSRRTELEEKLSVTMEKFFYKNKNDLLGQPLGVTSSSVIVSKLTAWLADFDESIKEACLQWMKSDSGGTWLVGPIDGFDEFKMYPEVCLQRIKSTLQFQRASPSAAGRVIWCLENKECRGLEDFEAEAVFGGWLQIDILRQVRQGKSLSKLIICGRLRKEVVGLSFQIDDTTPLKALAVSLFFILLAAFPVATIFISREQAIRLSSFPRHWATILLRCVLKRKKASLGLWVPVQDTDRALDDLPGEIEPLVRLNAGAVVYHVAFADKDIIRTPGRFAQSMARAEIKVDSTLSGIDPMTDLNESNRFRYPYLHAGSYQPQHFDLRISTGLWNSDRWVNMIPLPFTGYLEKMRKDSHKRIGLAKMAKIAWEKCWDDRFRNETEKLAQLLDWRRMESYFSREESSLNLAQRYHEYRIYNWPKPDPSPRTTLLHCGNLSQPLKIRHILKATNSFRKGMGPRWRITGQPELIEASIEESGARIGVNSPTLMLTDQINLNQYLHKLDQDRSIREDVGQFIDFMPPYLGRVLEIGSGEGLLSKVLLPRSDFYVSLDLFLPDVKLITRYGKRPYLAADAHKLPFLHESFDSVVANNLLEHLYDPLMALREIHRVLRPGGCLLGLIPFDALNNKHSIRSHIWKADEASVRLALEHAEFELVRLEVVNIYSLGVRGSFPSCNGLVGQFEAAKRR